MKPGIRASAALMVLVPTLLPALALSSWLTRERLNDARSELEQRGEREAMYLANASELAMLVGDSETLQRLAASNLEGPGAASAILFLDARGALLASGGPAAEVGYAQSCLQREAECSGQARRQVFQREILSGRGDEDAAAFGSAGAGQPEVLLGRVALSFDPRALESIQRALLQNSAALTVGALLIAALLAQLFARRLTEPIQRLSSVVARIRAGDLQARTTPGGAGELRELEEGVNAMADRVEAASVELNRRVDEATAELSHALMERELRNLELDRALLRAEAAGRAKDMFLARMSHELRTPLTTVTGFAQLMHRSASPEQRAEYYRAIAQSSGILVKTVDDILNFVKLGSGAMQLERRVFDLECCVEDAVLMQALAARQKGLDLVCHVSEGVPRGVCGDSLRLSQVLGNLISNAIKFTHEGHVMVRVSAGAVRDGACELEFEVSDTGIGIDEHDAQHLLQPFTQADESMTRRFGGSGLGLAITTRIVDAHGGSIALSGTPGVGTRATVRIPLPVVEGERQPPAARFDARVNLHCAPHSPHRAALQDYLLRAFAAVELRDGPPAASAGDCDLQVVVNGRRAGATAGDTPVLWLEPIELAGGELHGYHTDSVPLPPRRSELIAACMRRLAPGTAVSEPAPAPGAGCRFDLGCIVVEDNELNRRLIATRLRELGLRVVEAEGGREALQRLAGWVPDLLLLDVHMPEMDGITLAQRIRELHPGLPVYALTANVIGSEEQALRAAGVREVLYKPLDEERLLAVLGRHAREPRARIVARAGVGVAEIRAELLRLCTGLGEALARTDRSGAGDAAHQLLGAARMFTSGDLAQRCHALECALRAGSPVTEEFRALQSTIAALAAQPG